MDALRKHLRQPEGEEEEGEFEVEEDEGWRLCKVTKEACRAENILLRSRKIDARDNGDQNCQESFTL